MIWTGLVLAFHMNIIGMILILTDVKEVQYINLPLKYKDRDGETVVKSEPWPCLDVHETLAFLFEEAQVDVPQSEVRHYWQESRARGEPWASHEESDTFIPIGLFGDGATVRTKVGSEHIVSIFFNVILWRPKSVRWSRFLVFTMPEERATATTLSTVMRRITWSCNHAWYGFFPSQGFQGERLSRKATKRAGQPLTSKGHRFQITEIRGDWSWHHHTWKFHETHWLSDKVCHLCDARGLSSDWSQCYWNLDSNSLEDFSLVQFLAERMPPARLCAMAAETY